MCIGENLPYFYGVNSMWMACIDHYPLPHAGVGGRGYGAGGRGGGLSGGMGRISSITKVSLLK